MKDYNHGIYHLYSIDEQGNEKHLHSTNNLIVDKGLDLICTYNNTPIITRCVVSSDNSPVYNETNQLSGIVAASTAITNTDYGCAVNAPYYYWYKTTFEFGAGQTNGNLSKVAITTADGSLFSSALFQDDKGSPITIQLMGTERLKIIYEYRVYVDTTDLVIENVKIVNNSNTTYTITIRPARINDSSLAQGLNLGLYASMGANNHSNLLLRAYKGPITKITGEPSQSLFDKSSGQFTFLPYDPGTFIKNLIVTFDFNEFNTTDGIASMMVGTTKGFYQIGFDPPLIKTNKQTMTITFPFTVGR